jgi:hypothetical protein
MSQVQTGLTSRTHWPIRSWQFWSGLLVGIGTGLLIGAALVELEWLTITRKAWCSLLGCLLFGAGVTVIARRGKRV